MSAIDNLEVNQSTVVASQQHQDEQNLAELLKTNNFSSNDEINIETYRIRSPKRVLHFSDGTIEEYDSDESEIDLNSSNTDHPRPSTLVEVNPKSLSWPAWFQHYTSRGAHRTLGALDSAGETIAYYLGITTPKYQYEIDEYNRMKEEAEAKQKHKDEELASWGSGGKPDIPITAEDKVLGTDSQQVQLGQPSLSTNPKLSQPAEIPT